VEPMTVLAIGLAFLSAVSLAYGALLQHRGVSGLRASEGTLRIRTLVRLVGSPHWVLGLVVMAAGIVANVTALAFAPVMVVQPVGAFSLVISILLGMFHRSLAVHRTVVVTVILCVVGVAGFVTVSALVATTSPTSRAEADLLALLALVFTVIGLVVILVVSHPRQLLLITGGGILFAFVATNMHVVSSHIVEVGLGAGLASLPWSNAVALAASGLVGSWFVQSSYASGPPEMVIAGLTVIDPIVAVLLGALLLGEAADSGVASILGMAAFGALACASVVVLSRHHPDAVAAERRRSRQKYGDDPGPPSFEEVSDPVIP